jgi:quinol monooxygenase YgiN
MAIAAIISFSAPALADNTIQTLAQTLKDQKDITHFVIGTKVQEPDVIQITSEWNDIQSPVELRASPAFKLLMDSIRKLNNSSLPIVTLVTLDRSPFADGIPPLIEYVKVDFPVSSTTPTFQAQIRADFDKFETLFRKRGDAESTGEVGLTIGWADDQESVHQEGDRERVTSFVVVRGWRSMADFEKAVKTEVFKEAIPILLGWGAPFELVSNNFGCVVSILMFHSGMLSVRWLAKASRRLTSCNLLCLPVCVIFTC